MQGFPNEIYSETKPAAIRKDRLVQGTLDLPQVIDWRGLRDKKQVQAGSVGPTQQKVTLLDSLDHSVELQKVQSFVYWGKLLF